MRKAILLNNINSFIKFVKEGNIVLFPTDTVWGIGVFVEREDKIKEIFEIKKRDFGKKLPLLVGTRDYIYSNFHLCEIEKKIVENFMPGPLTIILKSKKEYSQFIMKDKTVAVRIPDCSVLRNVLSLYPMAATSANISGKAPLKDEREILSVFGRYNVGIVNFNMCISKGVSSTIIRIEDDNLQILREGIIKREKIEEVIFNDRP